MKQTLRSVSLSYTVIEPLGEGLNSVVYKAVRSDPFHHMHQTVALKILKSKNLVEVWKKEFASLEKVVCKHCVRLFSFDWLGERPALVLEYVNGISLRQLCLSGKLPRELALEILAQTQVGLKSLQRHGICHGDLSPNNIMIDELGTVRLLDFGWANSMENRIQVTADFAAPELLAGGKPNFEADLYSLGVIESLLTDNASLRLSKWPHQRPCFEIGPNEQSQRSLAAYVTNIRKHQKKFSQVRTRSIFLPTKQKLSIIKPLLAACLLTIAPKSECFSENILASGTLRLRTQTWTKFFLNGRELGFAPLDLSIEAGRLQRLSWQTKENAGTIHIYIEANAVKVIHEQDLHP